MQTIECFAFDDSGQRRDSYMAENILALQDHLSDHRVVFVAANWHVSKAPIRVATGEDFRTTGSHLADALGSDYRCIASASHHGQYLAITDEEPSEEDIARNLTPPPDSVEHHLERYATDANTSELFLNLDSKSNERLPWTDVARMNVGAAGRPTSTEATFVEQHPSKQFDALYFVRETSPISVLPQYYHFHKVSR